MESFTRRVESEDESPTTEFSTISDYGFVSSEELRPEVSEVSSTDFEDEIPSTDSVGSMTPSPKRMALFEGPEFLRRLNVFEEVEHGGRVTFECQCKAHPVPVSKWYKDDVELVEGDRMKIEDLLEIDGTLRLIISNVRKSDEGAYRCKLENQEGVAATTGYLSVTGNSSSPKSEYAVSAAPLLRAITEESNVSQDSEEGATPSSTSLEKILTGEYDVTTLPYSHYLELLKESESDRSSAPGNSQKNGGNRTPTEHTPSADDIKNLCTDFAYDTSIPFTDDDDVSYVNDQLVTTAMNQREMDAEEIANRPKAEVIFGTPLLTDSKTVFVIEGPRKDVSTDESDNELLKNSEEILEEMENERVSGLRLEGTQGEENAMAEGYEVDLEFGSNFSEPLMGLDSEGDFGKKGVFESLDENRLKETVIAGRIGMPSDWEFAHYTSEADEGEDILNAIPDDANATPRLPVETLRSKHEEEEAVLAAEMGSSPLADEAAVSASKNLADKESDPREVTLQRDALLGGNAAPETSDEEKIINVTKEEASDVPGNSDDSMVNSFLPDKMMSSVAEENIKRHDKPDEEDISSLASSDRIVLADIQPKEEVKEEVKRELTPESKPEGKPEQDDVTNWMPEMTPVAESVSGVPSLVNFNANSAAPEVAEAETYKPEVSGSSGDGLIQSTDTGGFLFADLMSDLKSSVTATSEWIPDVSISSYLPDLSPRELLSEQKPVDMEEIATEEPKSAIDWCVDWFRYPSIFYVLLVLTMTLVASATQMNPAMVVLVVALCSLLGFHLFPVQEK